MAANNEESPSNLQENSPSTSILDCIISLRDFSVHQNQEFNKPPLIVLHEHCSRKRLGRYNCVVEERIQNSSIVFLCKINTKQYEAEGKGKSKKDSKHDAALNLLKQFKGPHAIEEDKLKAVEYTWSMMLNSNQNRTPENVPIIEFGFLVRDFSLQIIGKSPVSALKEYCCKKCLGTPKYTVKKIIEISSKIYLCKVRVTEYEAEGKGKTFEKSKNDAALNILKQITKRTIEKQLTDNTDKWSIKAARQKRLLEIAEKLAYFDELREAELKRAKCKTELNARENVQTTIDVTTSAVASISKQPSTVNPNSYDISPATNMYLPIGDALVCSQNLSLHRDRPINNTPLTVSSNVLKQIGDSHLKTENPKPEFVNILYEHCDKNHLGTPEFEFSEQLRTFLCKIKLAQYEVETEATTKTKSKNDAAENLLKLLNVLPSSNVLQQIKGSTSIKECNLIGTGSGQTRKEANNNAAANILRQILISNSNLQEFSISNAFNILKDLCIQKWQPLPSFSIEQRGPPEAPQFYAQISVSSYIRCDTNSSISVNELSSIEK